jgi:thymidine phosphorylase
MSVVLDAIEEKKWGRRLPDERIRDVVEGYTAGDVPDYQMAALLMAIFIRGMDYEETLAMTRVMADSGKRYSFPECVDKHSTGGIGDKISLTSLPVVAACGAPVAKLSGRGLGHTGGTIDKLEAIPGFNVALTSEAFERQVSEVGFAIVEASDAAPADKGIYALRDATGTVDSLPLIGSSIVSKKVATGAGHLIYDVKCGSGAFMKTPEAARELADLLVRLSESLGIRSSAVITDMDQPLGSAIGNSLEIREALRFLKGEPVARDLDLLAREISVELLKLKEITDPERRVEEAISSGAGYEKFREFVRAQGGDDSALESLEVASEVTEVRAPASGYLKKVWAIELGRAALALGAGREKKDDAIDFAAGVEVDAKVGDRVEEGQAVARVYGSRNLQRALEFAGRAFEVVQEPVEPVPAILGRVQAG